jgi:D-alanine-D-alanine ligase
MPRYRVGVVFGSRSTEHEVSVISAMQVMQFLSERHAVVPIYITKSGVWLTGRALVKMSAFKSGSVYDLDLSRVVITPDTELQAVQNPLAKGLFARGRKLELDIVFPVLHGAHGEDGTIQGLLELADIPYVGAGVLASSIGMDKIATKAVLKENGLPVLDHVWFTRSDWERDHSAVVTEVCNRLRFPVIVKPSGLGSSIGVQKAVDVEELQSAIDNAIHYDQRILVESSIENLQEVNCAVLGNHDPIPSVCEQPVARGALLTYGDKYLHDTSDSGMAGATRVIPAPIEPELTERIQKLAVRAFRCIGGLGIARIDFMLDRDTQAIYVNEVNTMPGSISFYLWKASGIAPDQLVDRLLDLALDAHRDKHRSIYSVDTPLLQQSDMLALKTG